MMKEVNVVSELFAHKNIEIKSVKGAKVGMAAMVGTYEAPARTAPGVRARGAAKLSTAAKLFDVLSEGTQRIAVYGFDKVTNVCYVVFDGVGYLIDTAGEIKTTAEPTHHTTLILPLVMSVISADGNIQRLLTAVMGDLAKGVEPDAADLWQFCDEFYYGYAYSHRTINMDVGGLAEEEVKRLFDSSDVKRQTFGLDSELFAKSKFDKEEAPKKTTAKKTRKTSKSKTATFIDRCLAGEFIIPHEWDADQKELIAPIDFLKGFVPTEDFEEAVNAITKAFKKGEPLNGEFFGKPGTGKTTIMMALSAALGLPYYPIIFSKHTEEDVIEGKTRIIKGHPEFVLTDIPKYWDKGGLFDFEEINSADPGVLIAFNMALESPGIIMRNGYEKVYRSPLSFVFACMNTGIEGTNPMPPALSTRFLRKWRVADPTERVFKEILSKKTSAPEEEVDWVYEAYTKVINYLKSPEVSEDELVNLLSMRACIGCIENIEDGQSPVRAVKNSIVNSIGEADLALGDAIEAEVLPDLRSADF
ncbi:MAG: AAA family ATPase [Candidatus Weimeria sp.]